MEENKEEEKNSDKEIEEVILGDDRSVSVDSRSSAVGCIAEENIIGKVSRIILPISDLGSPEQLSGGK